MLPERNRKDIVDIPDSVRAEMEIVFSKKMNEVLERALEAMQVVVAGPDTANTPEATARA
jgi:ATP-dependent Lon protease